MPRSIVRVATLAFLTGGTEQYFSISAAKNTTELGSSQWCACYRVSRVTVRVSIQTASSYVKKRDRAAVRWIHV
jgi:hypothetical protein